MMRLRPWLSFYVESSMHVGLAVISLLGISALEFNTSLDFRVYLLIFCGTLIGYNFIKYYRSIKEGHSELPIPVWLFWFVNMLAGIGIVYSSISLDTELLLVMGAMGLVTLFYDFPLNKSRNLRNRSGLKILLVALVWTGVTICPAIYSAGLELKGDLLFSITQRFLFIVLLTLPFEIRDLKEDDSSLGTLPQILGIEGTKKFGFILALIIVGMEFAKSTQIHVHMVVLIYLVVISYLSLLLSRSEQRPFFASFWVEGIPIAGYLLALSLSG
ncbi:hypothetical protein [Aureitalea marina]|uniref:Prenyltransferase n=1 Tax=Aureitalea marina TaxID=930804 RepID=A0A2S7KQS4_9FLAO|nr:hypothetical protein [Aureitalea marina]PQB04972.1 hypothetical protein BST85_08755 [Aureitalea marina]